MKMIARDRLRDLIDEGLRVLMEERVKGGIVAPKLLSKLSHRHSEAISGNLGERFGGTTLGPQEHRRTNHSLVPDEAHLDRAAVLHRDDQRHDATQREEDVCDRLIGLEQHMLEAKRNAFK